MFATGEAIARAHPDSTPEMPLVLEVEPGNEHARGVYEHWGFKVLEYEEVLVRGRYLRMLREATEPEPPDEPDPRL
jgi:ribosomal protein S18 acetylase RimI-like enzyme